MIHNILTDKNYKKAVKIYAKEKGFLEDFTIDELITDNEFFCENHESIWKTAEREQLYIYIDDEKDIKSQLKGCGATTTEIIKALLDCRKTYLNTLNNRED